MWESKVKAHLDEKFNRDLMSSGAEAVDQSNYDVRYYDVFIRVNDTTEIIYGHNHFYADCRQYGTYEIQVDMYRTMSVDSVVGATGPLTFTHLGDYIYITLDKVYYSGQQIEFTVYYHGHPTETGFQAMAFGSRNGYDVITTLSEPYGARNWWPCKDLMADKPDSMGIAIQVDTSFYVGSNGTLDSTVANGDNTHTVYYTCSYPIASYLFSLSISVYHVWEQQYYYNGGADSMPVVHAVYPDLYSFSLPLWGITPNAIAILADAYGPYPFLREKYGHSNFQWGGGMEHQTMTSMVGSSFGFSEPVVVHELSHQWWGDMITCKSWQDIWLNEGWASYSEAVYYLDLYGWDYYRSYMNSMRYTGGGTIYVNDTTSISQLFNGGLSYDKGAWVVHMLRGVLGESLFAAAVDAYYHSEYQYGSATTEDFKNVLEEATGVELDWFFEEWIHGTYYPHYSYSYTSVPSDTGGYDVYVVVKQTQTTSPGVFHMPVDLVFDYVSAPQDTLVRACDEKRKLLKFNFASDITNIALDPADWILKSASNVPWETFIVTLPEELSDGIADEPYNDTIEVIGGGGPYVFTVTNGSLPAGLSLDNDGIISGITSDTGTFNFGVYLFENTTGKTDSVGYSLYMAPGSCCGKYTGGFSGNTDCSADGEMTLSDITTLIDNVYISHQALCCPENGNVDGSADPDPTLSDITRLIDRVYITHSPTAACQ